MEDEYEEFGCGSERSQEKSDSSIPPADVVASSQTGVGVGVGGTSTMIVGADGRLAPPKPPTSS